MVNNYCQKHKERFQKEAYERYQNLSEDFFFCYIFFPLHQSHFLAESKYHIEIIKFIAMLLVIPKLK